MLPLKTRTRNLTDFHIEPEEPHRKYAPGDLVKGAVVLTIVKPIRITHLTVCLHGFVRVFKHPNGAKEPLPELTATGNSTKSQYFGNGHASLFQDEVPLCGEGRLDTGVYEFKFELEFPRKGCPSSIDVSPHTSTSQVDDCKFADPLLVRERDNFLYDHFYTHAADFDCPHLELRTEDFSC